MRTGALTTGLVLAFLLGLSDLVLAAAPDVPAPVIVIGALLGLITLAGAVLAWRGDRRGIWAIVATRTLSALSAVPGLFVEDIPEGMKAGIAVSLVATIITLALLAPALRRHTQASS